jgi:tRNA(Ile)-lysidine synthase
MAHRSGFYARWALEMRRKGLFHPGERVGVAVSGGPDSVLLLDFLKDLAREVGLRLAVVHFNHHLRGAESDADEEFVRKLAEASDLDFLRGEAEVAEAARQSRRNLEATARDLRYRFFFALVNQQRLDKIATAHSANDQAETVLLHLLRGTGTRGLGGIYPVLDGKVVRPFLNLRRDEILTELAQRKLPYRIDSTNLDPRLRRNKVRRELLPLLEKEFNPETVLLLTALADRARDDEAFLEQQARERAQPWRVREGLEERIPTRRLAESPPAMARRVLRQMLRAVRGSLRGVSHVHIESLRQFAAEAPSGRSLSLPGGTVARKEFEWLVLGPARPSARGKERGFSLAVPVPGELTVPQLHRTFRFKIIGREGGSKAYNQEQIIGLDPRKLRGGLVLRNWRAGDAYRPAGSRKLRKLKELFRQQKVPRERRGLWPVLECGREIVWVVGFPPASEVAASAESEEVLILEEEGRV